MDHYRARANRCIAVLVVCWALAGVAGAAADVTYIGGRDYFAVVHRELMSATNSVYVEMYLMQVSPGNPEQPAHALALDLVAAQGRGVQVTVLLDRSLRYSPAKKMKMMDTKNDAAIAMLRAAGVDVQLVRPSTVVHSKLIVIDGKTVIVGSTNWSPSALIRNMEASVLIRSPELAASVLAASRGAIAEYALKSERPVQAALHLRNGFLTDKTMGAQMVRRQDERAWDMWLLLVRQAQDDGTSLQVDMDVMASPSTSSGQAGLGIASMSRSAYRRQITKVLRKLESRYELIEAEFKYAGAAAVKITKPVSTNGHARVDFFGVPEEYWKYGLDRRLSLRAKHAYFINLYKTETSKTKWWSMAGPQLVEQFHVSEDAIRPGLLELEQAGVLQIMRSTVVDGDYSQRPPNQYRLKPLVSPAVIQRGWQALAAAHGDKALADARRLAESIDRGYDQHCVAEFIRITAVYGARETKKATRMVAKMHRGNPSRHVGYVVGILKQRAEGKPKTAIEPRRHGEPQRTANERE